LDEYIKYLNSLKKVTEEFSGRSSAAAQSSAHMFHALARYSELDASSELGHNIPHLGEALRSVATGAERAASAIEQGAAEANKAFTERVRQFAEDVTAKHQEAKSAERAALRDVESALDKVGAAKAEEEAAMRLAEARQARRSAAHARLEYALSCNSVAAQKGIAVSGFLRQTVRSQLEAYRTAVKELEAVEDILQVVEDEAARAFENRAVREKALRAQRDSVLAADVDDGVALPCSNALLEGYLWKHTTGVKSGWRRRWFAVRHGRLEAYKESTKELRVGESFDLLMTSAKPAMGSSNGGRLHVFEVTSRAAGQDRSLLLQAESQEGLERWLTALQEETSRLLNEGSADSAGAAHRSGASGALSTSATSPNPSSSSDKLSSASSSSSVSSLAGGGGEETLAELRSVDPGNAACADCGAPNPDWCSLNHGVLVCLQCSGAHRSQGVHVSKVRSLTLDALEPELLELLRQLGNTRTNSVLAAGTVLDGGNASLEERTAYVKTKYADKAGVDAPRVDDAELRAASRIGDVLGLFRALSALWRDVGAGGVPQALTESGALHAALHGAHGGSDAASVAKDKGNLGCLALLLLSGADANAADAGGQMPLHAAAAMGSVAFAEALLRFRGDPTARAAATGQSPAEVARTCQFQDVYVMLARAESRWREEGRGMDVQRPIGEADEASSGMSTPRRGTASDETGANKVWATVRGKISRQRRPSLNDPGVGRDITSPKLDSEGSDKMRDDFMRMLESNPEAMAAFASKKSARSLSQDSTPARTPASPRAPTSGSSSPRLSAMLGRVSSSQRRSSATGTAPPVGSPPGPPGAPNKPAPPAPPRRPAPPVPQRFASSPAITRSSKTGPPSVPPPSAPTARASDKCQECGLFLSAGKCRNRCAAS
jgi:flagellar hook-basal body complex protein FliE